MDLILIILIAGSLIGVGKTLHEMQTKKKEKKELRDRLGNDYDEFIEMRKNKRRT